MPLMHSMRQLCVDVLLWHRACGSHNLGETGEHVGGLRPSRPCYTLDKNLQLGLIRPTEVMRRAYVCFIALHIAQGSLGEECLRI